MTSWRQSSTILRLCCLNRVQLVLRGLNRKLKAFDPLHLSHYLSHMFQIIKQMLILDKDNLSKYKIQFLHGDFIY